MTATIDNVNAYQVLLEATNSVPVDLDGIARRLGVQVLSTFLPDEVSGSIERLQNGSYVIHVNSQHAETRRRFTLAHELGHFVSHRHLLGQGTNDNRAYRTVRSEKHFNPAITQAHETEANRFAASLLMPEKILRDMYISLGKPSADQLAKVFKVSGQAMEIRLNALKRRWAHE